MELNSLTQPFLIVIIDDHSTASMLFMIYIRCATFVRFHIGVTIESEDTLLIRSYVNLYQEYDTLYKRTSIYVK